MAKAELKEILDRVLTWPPERQADVAYIEEKVMRLGSAELPIPAACPNAPTGRHVRGI
jgi:hypothetical protein